MYRVIGYTLLMICVSLASSFAMHEVLSGKFPFWIDFMAMGFVIPAALCLFLVCTRQIGQLLSDWQFKRRLQQRRGDWATASLNRSRERWEDLLP